MGIFSRLFGRKNKNKATAEYDIKTQQVACAPEKNKEPLTEELKTREDATVVTAVKSGESKTASTKATKNATAPATTKTTEPKATNAKATKSATSPATKIAKSKATQAKATKSATAPAETKSVEPKASKAKNTEDAASTAPTAKERTQAGFFEIKKSRDDRYVFNLYASNRVIIATSQIYSSSQAAQNGINSVIANAEKAGIEDNSLKNPTAQPFPKWEIYRDKAEQFRFRLYASNGSCICHSQGYTSKASCKNGIESIIRTAKTASVDKSYLIKK